MDTSCCDFLTSKEIEEALKGCADKICVVDVTKPLEAFADIMKGENDQLMDLTVNCEDLIGTETLSVLMTEPKGQLYFTSLKNNYNRAVLVAEKSRLIHSTSILMDITIALWVFSISSPAN